MTKTNLTNKKKKSKTYLITRHSNLYWLNSLILDSILDYYDAELIVLNHDPKSKQEIIDLNSRISVCLNRHLSESKAIRLGSRPNYSSDRSMIYSAQNANYLTHLPTSSRKVRCMVGIGEGPFALLVEIVDENTFNIRNLEERNLEIYDNGLKFDLKGVSRSKDVTCVFGDLHDWTKDPVIYQKFVDHALQVNANHVVLHDFFDAVSINHHEINRPLSAFSDLPSLGQEAEASFETLLALSSVFNKLSIVNSNHDEFITKIMDSLSNFERIPVASRPLLFGLFAQIAQKKLNAEKVEVSLLEMYNCLGLDIPSNINFWSNNEEYSDYGYLLSLHGDKGANGARYNHRTSRQQNVITGHSHVGGFYQSNFSVGHATQVCKQYYAQGGLSSWTHSLVDIYPNGTAQLVSFF